MEKKIYVANLAAYVSGELVGKWIDLPCEEDELSEQIQAVLDSWNDGYGPSEEMAIHDYELPFKVGEYDDPYKINATCQRIDDADINSVILDAIADVMGCDYEEALDIIEAGDYTVYHDCCDMSDVAYSYYESTGMLSEIPDHLANYIDWQAIGRDMDIEGTFQYAGNSLYVQVTQ